MTDRPYPPGLETPPKPILPADAARQDDLAELCRAGPRLVPRCHPETPFIAAKYETDSGVLELSCAYCGKECMQVAVAPGSRWPDFRLTLTEAPK